LTIPAKRDRVEKMNESGANAHIAQLRKGEEFEKLGQLSEALSAYRDALDLMPPDAEIEDQALIQEKIGMMNCSLGNPDLALKFLRRSLALLEGSETPNLARVLAGMGWAYYKKGQYSQAARWTKEGLKELERIEPDEEAQRTRGRLILVIGDIHYRQGNLDVAAQKYMEAELIYGTLGDVMGRGRTHHRIGLLQTKLGDYDLAVVSLERSAEMFAQAGNLFEESATAVSLGECLYHLGRWEEAEDRLTRARRADETVGNKKGVAVTDLTLARLCMRKGDFPRATSLIKAAEDIVENLEDFMGSAYVELEKGRLQLLRRDPGAAISHLEAALDRFTVMGRPMDQVEALSLLSMARMETGRLRQAAKALEAAKTLLLEKDLEGGGLSLSLYFGSLLRRQDKYDEAFQHLQAGLARQQVLHDPYEEARLYLEIGLVYLGRAGTSGPGGTTAKDYLDRSENLFASLGAEPYLKMVQDTKQKMERSINPEE